MIRNWKSVTSLDLDPPPVKLSFLLRPLPPRAGRILRTAPRNEWGYHRVPVANCSRSLGWWRRASFIFEPDL